MKRSITRPSAIAAFIAVPIALLSLPNPSYSQFDKLLRDMQKNFPQQGSPNSVFTPQSAQKGGAAKLSGLNLCESQIVAKTSRSRDEVDRLLLTEFKVSGEQFFNDAFTALIEKPRTSAAIPSLNDFIGTFETQRGNRLFSTLLAWPEPEVAAEVIAELENKRDPQLANDASMILILLHWAIPKISRQEGAWLNKANAFRVIDPNSPKAHIPACYLWARLYATGESGKVLPNDALGQFNTCGNIPQAYRDSNGQREVNRESYTDIVLSPSTLRIISKSNPRALSQMGPFAQNLKNLGDSSDAEQDAYRKQFGSTAPGRTAAAATGLVSRAEDIGAKAIKSSQQLSRSYGDLQANLKQVQSGQGTREGEFIPSAAAQVRLALMAKAANNSQGYDPAALNEVRQLLGGAAVGLTQARNAVVQEMLSAGMSLASKGDNLKAALAATRAVRVAYDLDFASIRSCLAYNSFAQAARARNVSTADDDKAGASFMNNMMKQ